MLVNCKKTTLNILFILLLCIVFALGINADVPGQNYWYEQSVVCHAMGYIDGNGRTNSLESFLYNYEKVGMRLFEIDLIATSDDELVLSHNFENKRQPGIEDGGVPSLEKFLSIPIYEKYTPLSFRDLIKLCDTHPDSYFIIDPKMDSFECYKRMLEELDEEGRSEYTDRFVVQVFNENELKEFKRAFSYKNYIFASFDRGISGTLDFIKLCAVSYRNGVRAFLVKEEYWKPYYSYITRLFKITAYTHVTNDISKAIYELSLNFDGFYTDSINNANWYDDKLIAHALGGINEDKSTNSKEAFIHNYKDNGMRVFEVDFMKSSDDVLLLTHEFDEKRQSGINDNGVPSKDYFMSIPIWGKYTPMSIDDLYDLMEEYPGCYIMTDVKNDDTEYVTSALKALVERAEATDRTQLLDAVIVQFYHEDQLEAIKQIYPFKNYVYTLYMTGFDESEKMFLHNVKFCQKNGIDVLTVRKAWWHKEYAKIKDRYGVKVFLHTINETDKAQTFFDQGVDGLYTDFLTHEDVEKMVK